jgi:O-antigen ligase
MQRTFQPPNATPWLEAVEVAPDVAEGEDRAWDLLLVCVAGYLLTAVGRIQQLFPFLELMRPAILTGAIALVLFLMDTHESRRLRGLAAGTTWCLSAYFGWMVLSLPAALVLGNSFDLVVNNFSKTFLMFFVVAGAIRGPRDVERLMFTYLISATLYAAVVIAQFDVGGSTWRLGHLFYYDANDFATYAVTAIPFGVYFLSTRRLWITQALSAGALAVLTVAFVRSGSRGGFVALAVAGVYMLFRFTAIPVIRRVTATAIVVIVIAGAASSQYWEQMGTIMSDSDYNRSNESGRMHIWERGIGYMLRFPVLGVGPGNFPTAEGTLSAHADRQQFGVGVRWNAPHNIFVQAGAELGVVGLLLFIGLFVTAFRALRVAAAYEAAATGGPPAMSQALTASLLAFVVGGFFLSLAYSEMLFALLAVIVGWHKVAVNQSQEALEPA